MISLRVFIFAVLAIACVFAFPAEEKVKKDVLLGNLGYSGIYSGAYVPTAYNGFGVAPIAPAVSAYSGLYHGYY